MLIRNADHLFRQAQGGDEEARATLVTANERLVLHCAKSYTPTGSVTRDDIIAEGYIGLIEAIDKHDPARGNNFGNFAAVHIRSKMLAAVQGSAWALPCPPEWYALQRRASRMRDQLAIDLGRQPTTEELSSMLGVTPALMEQVMEAEALRIDGDDSLEWNEPGLGDQTDQVLAAEMVKMAMGALTPEQQELVRQRFIEGLTLEAMGERHGHSHQAVSMSVKRAVSSMRRAVSGEPVAAGAPAYCCN